MLQSRRPLLYCIILTIVLIGTAPTPVVGGTVPPDPLDLDVGDSLSIILGPGEETWVRAISPPAPSDTHVIFSYPPRGVRLRLFATLEDALADDPLVEDTSGSLTHALGFPEFYVQLVVETTGTEMIELATSTATFPVEQCPWSGPCAAVVVVDDRPSGPALLKTARSFRDELLASTPRGRALIGLYYDLSVELVPHALARPSLAADLFGLVEDLIPTVASALSIARGEKEDSRIPASAFAVGTELCNLVRSLSLSSSVSEGIGRICSDALGQEGGSLRQAMDALGVLPPDASKTFKILVKFAQNVDAPTITSSELSVGDSAVDSLFRGYAVAAVEPVFPRLGEHGMNRIFAITFTPSTTTSALIDSLSRSQLVEWAEPDLVLWALSDVYYPDQWGLHKLNVDSIRKITLGSPQVIVAVIDTGLDTRHADFRGAHIVAGYDFVNDDRDPHDGHGHGTHVSGVIAAVVDNGYGVAGIAPRVTIVPVKVLSDEGSGTASGVAQGIRYAADLGARVISLSLGGGRTQVIEEAVRYAREKGALLVAAAGNDGEEALLHPAASAHVMAISATDEKDELASFSNYGEGINLGAPGVDVVSTFLEGVTCLASGTSMATPHVSGVAALALTVAPDLSADELKEHLHRTAVDLGAPGWDPFFGYGLVSAQGALRELVPDGLIFADGFDTGNSSAWSRTVN